MEEILKELEELGWKLYASDKKDSYTFRKEGSCELDARLVYVDCLGRDKLLYSEYDDRYESISAPLNTEDVIIFGKFMKLLED